jgi:hypothetical protein
MYPDDLVDETNRERRDANGFEQEDIIQPGNPKWWV